MKNLFLGLILFCFYACVLPQGSNIRTATVRFVNNDTIKFYGSAKRFILEKRNCVSIGEKIQYTILKNGHENSLPIIRKLNFL